MIVWSTGALRFYLWRTLLFIEISNAQVGLLSVDQLPLLPFRMRLGTLLTCSARRLPILVHALLGTTEHPVFSCQTLQHELRLFGERWETSGQNCESVTRVWSPQVCLPQLLMQKKRYFADFHATLTVSRGRINRFKNAQLQRALKGRFFSASMAGSLVALVY